MCNKIYLTMLCAVLIVSEISISEAQLPYPLVAANGRGGQTKCVQAARCSLCGEGRLPIRIGDSVICAPLYYDVTNRSGNVTVTEVKIQGPCMVIDDCNLCTADEILVRNENKELKCVNKYIPLNAYWKTV